MKELKFLFIGLANAGKTSILRTLDNDLEKIPSLTPTAGVAYNTFKVMGFTVSAWDLGGQLKYRKKYLQEYERYFQQTAAVFYVIDIQEQNEYKESLAYLESIRRTFEDLKDTKMPFTILLHKYDPHVREKDINIEKDMEALKTGVQKVLGQYPHTFFETTIYEPHTIFKAFSETILNHVPNRDIIVGKLEEIATEFSSKMAILLDNGGYIYGQYHSKAAQLLELSKFIRICQEFSQLTTKQSFSEFTLLSLDGVSDVAMTLFLGENELFLLGMLVPHSWLEQDTRMQENFIKKKNELLKILKVFE